eukprot:501824_1
MAEDEYNPYMDLNLVIAREEFCPTRNRQFEDMHHVVHREHASDSSDSIESNDPAPADRKLRGHEANTAKLVSKYVRDHEDELELSIPQCIGTLCFEFSYEPTNITFDAYDPRISQYINVSQGGKAVDMSARTIFIFSKDGYDLGHHMWHIKCHRVYNCQALGIAEHKDPKYRYGENIFDVTLNEQLGDRYVYAGDHGHSWRGSNDLRPYVCSVISEEEYYSKRLNLKNSRWQVGDIITVNLELGNGRKDDDTKRTITFLKNGKALCEPIRIVKKCVYYPVFQVYQRG